MSEKKVQVILKTVVPVTMRDEIFIFCTKVLYCLLILQEKYIAHLTLKKTKLLYYSKVVFPDSANYGVEVHKGQQQKCFNL